MGQVVAIYISDDGRVVDINKADWFPEDAPPPSVPRSKENCYDPAFLTWLVGTRRACDHAGELVAASSPSRVRSLMSFRSK